jgi:tetratricopeptide (TPR) repeat protein
MNPNIKHSILLRVKGWIEPLVKALVFGLVASLFNACATVEPPPADPVPPIIVEVEEEELDPGSFTEEQLYQSIVSELSAQRGELEAAIESYFDLAFETRDLSIIQRAIQFASANNDLNAMLQLGLLWAEIVPDEPQPHLMLSFQFIESGRFEQALSHMSKVLELGGRFDFGALSSRTGSIEPQLRIGLINNLKLLSQRFPDHPSIQIALVQLLAQSGQLQAALDELTNLKENRGNSVAIAMLEAQLWQGLEESDRSLRVLNRALREFPDDKNLRFSYARLLIQDEQYEEAQEQFSILVEQDPEDYETYYSIALLDMEMDNFDQAVETFTRLVGVDHRVDESQYYLGFLYEQQEQFDKAIEHYRQVRIGTTNFLAAQQQATRFSIELGQLEDAHQWLSSQSQGQPRLEVLFTTIESGMLIQNQHMDEARELLNTALNKFPNDSDLLFARVLLFDTIKDSAASEKDLRQIISMQPEDSRALNHLGYMLADQTTRFEEALELIQRAIAIAPDDAAIIDSLAWAQYKLGRYEEALANLRRAFIEFPDPEVASHLGEVLWMMGREDEASKVWQDALDARPDSELLIDVIERFQSAD